MWKIYSFNFKKEKKKLISVNRQFHRITDIIRNKCIKNSHTALDV